MSKETIPGGYQFARVLWRDGRKSLRWHVVAMWWSKFDAQPPTAIPTRSQPHATSWRPQVVPDSGINLVSSESCTLQLNSHNLALCHLLNVIKTLNHIWHKCTPHFYIYTRYGGFCNCVKYMIVIVFSQNQCFKSLFSGIDWLGDNISFWYFPHFCWFTSVLAWNAFDFCIIINVFDFPIWQDGLWSKARHRCHLFWVLSVMSHRWRLAWDVWCFVVSL